MTNDAGMIIPTIDDADIKWACVVLGLPATAFSGTDGTDPRLPIIRSMDTLDIEACPGSGKTTLLVAKLAILARKWTESRCGLCVLSHTNVARREIETRLGNTAAGQRMLGYPHFFGTIHGFVNEFLALPWLRSLGYPIEMIDDEVCLRRRWQKLSREIQHTAYNEIASYGTGSAISGYCIRPWCNTVGKGFCLGITPQPIRQCATPARFQRKKGISATTNCSCGRMKCSIRCRL